MSNTQIAIDMLHVLEKVEAQRDELLQALELIASCDETCYVDGHGYIDIEEIAKKAIAKAKGE